MATHAQTGAKLKHSGGASYCLFNMHLSELRELRAGILSQMSAQK